MSKTILVVFLSVLAVNAQAQDVASPSNPLVGSWRLVSAEGHSTEGRIVYDWGKEPTGRAMFDASGRLSLHLIDPDRRNFESGDFLRPTKEELKEAFNGYFGYFGSYTIDEDEEVVTFNIDGAAYPNYVGTDQRRFFSIEENLLTLRTPPERAGDADITYYITWEREL